MADVVAVGADDLTDHEDVAGQQGAGAAAGLRVDVGRVVAAVGAAGPVRAGGLGRGVEVEPVGAVDQHHPDRQVVVVDLVDPVDQRGLLGQHVRGAEVRRVAGVGEEGEAVGPALDHLTGRLPGRGGDRPGQRVEVRLDQRTLGGGQGGPQVAEVGRGAAPVERGVDVPGAGAPRRRARRRGSPSGSGRAGSWRSGRSTPTPAYVRISGCRAARRRCITDDSWIRKVASAPDGSGSGELQGRGPAANRPLGRRQRQAPAEAGQVDPVGRGLARRDARPVGVADREPGQRGEQAPPPGGGAAPAGPARPRPAAGPR